MEQDWASAWARSDMHPGPGEALTPRCRKPNMGIDMSLSELRFASRAVRVLAALALVVFAGRTAPNASASPPYRGVQLHSLWWDTTYAQMYRDLHYASIADATAVRVDVAWSSLQTDGPRRFSSWYVHKLDAFMHGARARGMKVIATLYSTPCWASSSPPVLKAGCTGDWWNRGVTAFPPANDADFARIARWVTARYGRDLAALEIWNEPDAGGQPFWRTPHPAVDYAQLLRAAYPAARRGDPSVPVLAGALASCDRRFLQQLYRAGIKGFYDGLSVHPYVEGSPYAAVPTGSTPEWTFGPGLRWIHALQRASGDRAPIWVTEFGWSTVSTGAVSSSLQARYILGAFSILKGLRYVRSAIVYNLRDTGGDRAGVQDNFGLLDPGFAPKPGFWAFAHSMGRSAAAVAALIGLGAGAAMQ